MHFDSVPNDHASTADQTHLYPSYDSVYFYFDLVPADRYEDLYAALSGLLGRAAAPKEPGVRCTTLVARWAEFEQQFVTPFAAAAAEQLATADETSRPTKE